MPRSILVSSVTSALLVLPNLGLLAQQTTPGTPPQSPPPTEGAVETPEPADNPAASGTALHWLKPEFSAAQAVSEFASGRVQDERVRAFATQAAQSYAEIAQRIESAAPAVQPAPATVGASEVGEELKDVAERIQEAADEPATAPERTRPAQRERAAGPRSQNAVEDGQRPPPATQPSDQPVARDEDEQPSGRRLLRQREDREGGILERLRGSADDGRRGSARQRLQRALPVLRETAPELVELITQVVEEGSAPGAREWIELQETHARRYAQSVQEELGRYRGEALAQAYLGYATLAGLRLQDALEVARQQAGQQAAPVLDDALQTVQSQTREARKLMEDLTNRPTAQR